MLAPAIISLFCALPQAKYSALPPQPNPQPWDPQLPIQTSVPDKIGHSVPVALQRFANQSPPKQEAGQDTGDEHSPDAEKAEPGRDPIGKAMQLEDVAPRLVELMRTGIETLSPNASFTKKDNRSTPFDGSYDWHSSVIAHWALLVSARTRNDLELRDWVLKRLPPEVLQAEFAAMLKRSKRSRITYPYDEAWFCMLLSELQKHPSWDGDSLLQSRQALEGRLIDYLEGASFPENLGAKEGEVRYCGFYRSTMFLYLLMRWQDSARPDTDERLGVWKTQVLHPHRSAIAARTESHGYDFLSVPALLALVDRLEPDAQAIHNTGQVGEEGLAQPQYRPPEFSGWPDSVVIRTVHILGLELTRMWPLAVDAGKDDATALKLYRKRVESLLARPEFWSEDFAACSHWIPQYLFIGEWLRAGRP